MEKKAFIAWCPIESAVSGSIVNNVLNKGEIYEVHIKWSLLKE